MVDRRKNYVGKHITVHDNRAICSHAAECVRNLPPVFRLGERPWVNADGADLDEIIQTVRKCPSGALSYSIDDAEDRDPKDRRPMMTVSKDGPYLVTGGISLRVSRAGVRELQRNILRCADAGFQTTSLSATGPTLR